MTVAVTATTEGLEVVGGSTTVVDVGRETEETEGEEVDIEVSDVDVELSVTVTVVVGEVVTLTDVVVTTEVMVESVTDSVVESGSLLV